jgi:rhodanese-related sulfurtransferase
VAAFFSLVIYLTQAKVQVADLFSKPAPAPVVEPSVRLEIINLADALQLFHNPSVVFLDVRAKRYFDYGHIKGALNLPFEELSGTDAARIATWKEAPAVVVYCNGVACGTGFASARHLMEQGLDNVKIYVEGWPEWRLCRLPMTMSAEMKRDVTKGGP